MPAQVRDELTIAIASVTQFLQGSTSKRVPYEIAYCLKDACLSWSTKRPLITTSLSPDLYRGFYFLGVNPAFYSLTKVYFGIEFEADLVQISMPEIYRTKPLFCTALYHELGHYVDVHREITSKSLLIEDIKWELPGVSQQSWANETLQRNHRMEYFADLFSAMYCGDAGRSFLMDFAGSDGPSMTHPSTSDRAKVVEDFLNGRENHVVALFQQTLKSLGMPPLEQHFDAPALERPFENLRPCETTTMREVHGLFNSGWFFLKRQWENRSENWATMEDDRVEVVANDLLEKSIRNFMIRSVAPER